MNIAKLIKKIRNTKPVENLPEILHELGKDLQTLIDEADYMDRELTIVHETLTELYNYDNVFPIVRQCLNKIKTIRQKKIKKNAVENPATNAGQNR